MENSSISGAGYAGSSGSNTPGLDSAQPVLQQAQQKAGQVVDQARTQVVSQLQSQKERATGSMDSVAQALRQTGQQLQGQNHGAIAQYAESAAQAVERFSGYLNERDIHQLMGEAEDLARRQPGLFLGGAFLLGFMAARFLKSSSPGAAASATIDYASVRGAREYAGSGPWTAPRSDVAAAGAYDRGGARAADVAASGFAATDLMGSRGPAAVNVNSPSVAPSVPGSAPAVDLDPAEDDELAPTTRGSVAVRSSDDE